MSDIKHVRTYRYINYITQVFAIRFHINLCLLLGAFTVTHIIYTDLGYHTKKPKLYKNIELTVAKVH